ncbi:MAG: ATP-binding protein [bacterium]
MTPLTVPGTMDSLKPVRDYIDRAAMEAGLDKKDRYGLCLAVDEIATNIVMHGYEEAGLSGEIKVEGRLTAEALVIVLEDTGTEFDPTTRGLPTQEDLDMPLEDRPIGGLGILLTLDGVDDYHYERVGPVNRNTFIKRRPAYPGSGSPSP